MGLLSFLIGGTKTAEKVIDAGISGMDKLVFTEEEKADYNQKLQTMHLEFIKITANESTASSISRRMICLPVVYVWLGMIILKVVATIYGVPDVQLVSIQETIAVMDLPALTAIGFYCGRHIANSMVKK